MTPAAFTVFAAPAGQRRRLTQRPRLDSWDARAHPSQVAVQAFVDHCEDVLRNDLTAVTKPWSLHLAVGLPASVPLTSGGNDLDNYAFPLARRLGASAIASMHVEKLLGPSTLAVSTATPADPPQEGWRFASARSTASATSKQWKADIAAGITGQIEQPAAPGPVELHAAFRVSASRNWTTLWKPALDSLGAILGADPARPFAPHDDRIVRLGLHRTLDESIGWGVEIGVWWRAAALDAGRARTEDDGRGRIPPPPP